MKALILFKGSHPQNLITPQRPHHPLKPSYNYTVIDGRIAKVEDTRINCIILLLAGSDYALSKFSSPFGGDM
jgi:hypothetical protein